MIEKLTFNELKKLDLEEAKRLIGNYMYKHACIFERLEHAGKIYGNGHHIAQKFAQLAQNELDKRWITNQSK